MGLNDSYLTKGLVVVATALPTITNAQIDLSKELSQEKETTNPATVLQKKVDDAKLKLDVQQDILEARKKGLSRYNDQIVHLTNQGTVLKLQADSVQHANEATEVQLKTRLDKLVQKGLDEATKASFLSVLNDTSYVEANPKDYSPRTLVIAKDLDVTGQEKLKLDEANTTLNENALRLLRGNMRKGDLTNLNTDMDAKQKLLDARKDAYEREMNGLRSTNNELKMRFTTKVKEIQQYITTIKFAKEECDRIMSGSVNGDLEGTFTQSDITEVTQSLDNYVDKLEKALKKISDYKNPSATTYDMGVVGNTPAEKHNINDAKGNQKTLIDQVAALDQVIVLAKTYADNSNATLSTARQGAALLQTEVKETVKKVQDVKLLEGPDDDKAQDNKKKKKKNQ